MALLSIKQITVASMRRQLSHCLDVLDVHRTLLLNVIMISFRAMKLGIAIDLVYLSRVRVS